MRAVFRELRRRNVFRAALAYLAVAWLIVQIVETVFPVFELPKELIRWLIILLVIGFPVVVVFAWFYEFTAEGLMSTEDADAAGFSETVLNRRYIDFVIIALLAIAVAWLVYERQAGPDFPEKSVAVLAFDDMSPGKENEWFSNGLTEEILNSLARLPELQVPARYSTFYFKDSNIPISEVAQQLGVRYVIEGSVRRIENQLRVTAQLVRAADGYQLWSDSYDRTTLDVLDIQKEIAERIAEALDVVLDDKKREAMFSLGTRDVDAFENFLRGKQLLYDWFDDGDIKKIWQAKDWFDRAISDDPRFAAAYALRSQNYIQFLDLVISSPTGPSEPDSIITRAQAQEQLMRDASKVVQYAKDPGLRLVSEFNRVLYSDDFTDLPILVSKVNPKSLVVTADISTLARISNALLLLGHEDKAWELAKLRIERNPLSPLGYNEAWRVLHVLGDSRQAIDYLQQGLAVAKGSMFLEFNMQVAYLVLGRFDEASAMTENPNWGSPTFRKSLLAYGHAAAGRHNDARAVLETISSDYGGDEYTALALREMGETKEAERIFRWLDALPGRKQTLLFLMTEFGGKIPFDITWTPNLGTRLAEAGIMLERYEIPHSHQKSEID